jgi:hypothetical protein
MTFCTSTATAFIKTNWDPDFHFNFAGWKCDHGFYQDELGLGGLAFEEANHKTHLVTARDLGDLLNRRGIALAVLDACRTGREVEAKAFSSVAAQLITSGVGSVICMSYSVYVEAARIFTRRFYESLVAEQTMGAATRAGRESLKTNPVRLAEAGANRTLKDWFLPLLYQRGKDAAAVSRTTGPAPAARTEMPGLAGFPEPPRYGFIGRSFELLQVERTPTGVACSIIASRCCTALAAPAKPRWPARPACG